MPTVARLLLCLALVATSAGAAEIVTVPSQDGDLTRGAPTSLTAHLFRPPGEGPFPAVVALHGCGGLFRRDGRRFTARHQDWADRLVGLGFVVLFPDSLTPRGHAEVCRAGNEAGVLPGRERARDAYGALRFLQSQPYVRPEAVAVMGWSHGGSTALWAASPRGLGSDAPGFRLAIALYPGCGIAATGSKPRLPVHIFAGADDDWTPVGPCRAYADRNPDLVSMITYPGAGHGFDAPNQPRQVLTGLRSSPSGTATIGTEPGARADVLVRIPALLEPLKAR